jgi:pyruvate/2-oxoacid:ferredoxin oxidoreductase alpha subunit/pyruvate/2-oxoacid:ferredoxin oxidoreductase beta subunit/Pyruvate/2-oxoacid:ferredoxin oxidoreductase delta subunit
VSSNRYAPEYAAPAVAKPARFPGAASVADGADAVAWVESHISQAVCAAPAEPSGVLTEAFQAAIAARPANLWGEACRLLAAETGLAAASAAEGFALAGGRAASFTCGESLVAMKPVMHAIAGKRLPLVFHVTARAIASQGRSTQAGHDDFLSVADCGWAILIARDAQEAADFALIARRAAEYAETPVLCAQDAFLTSHTLEPVRLPEPELMREFAGAPADKVRNGFNPWRPLMSGPSQGADSYMRGRVAQRYFYDRVKPALESSMEEFAHRTRRRYGLIDSYAMEDAQFAFLGMGSMMLTARAAVDYLRRQGVRAGAVSVLAFRPFPSVELAAALANCRAVTVFERVDVPLSGSNPLTVEVKAALADAVLGRGGAQFEHIPEVHSAVAGIGGADIRPGHFTAAAENMRRGGARFFVLGVNHPEALPPTEDFETEPGGAFRVRIALPGAAGSLAARRHDARAAAERLQVQVRAYPEFDREKRGLPLSFAITLAGRPVRSSAALEQADLLIGTGDSAEGIRNGGKLCVSPPRAWSALPRPVRDAVREQNIEVWTLDGPPLHAIVRLAPFPSSQRGEAGASVLERMDIPASDSGGDAASGRRWIRFQPADGGLAPSDFRERIAASYCTPGGSKLQADAYAARGVIPASSALERSFRAVATELPVFAASACTGCMDCVNQCPDTAILARVVEPEPLEAHLKAVENREQMRLRFARTTKFPGGLFGLFVDQDKCKGCGECVTVCGSAGALRMASKAGLDLPEYDRAMDFLAALPDTPEHFLNEKSAGDILLTTRAQLYSGGAISCAGCGEATALRLLLAATGFVYGAEKLGIVAALGCNFCTSYPYNPASVPWTNTLFENAPADAMGIRLRWDQQGWQARRLWVVGGDEALVDAGFQHLSRLLASGMDVKVLLLDTHAGEPGHRDAARIAMMHPDCFVAQTTPSHLNHFYRSVTAANAHKGPALVVTYASCIREHDLAGDSAVSQARLAVDSRVFPLMVYDPTAGDSFRRRLSLQGNPAVKEDWYRRPRAKEALDFLAYARSEPRFATGFDAEGRPGPALDRIRQERLENWRRLQELAGVR